MNPFKGADKWQTSSGARDEYEYDRPGDYVEDIESIECVMSGAIYVIFKKRVIEASDDAEHRAGQATKHMFNFSKKPAPGACKLAILKLFELSPNDYAGMRKKLEQAGVQHKQLSDSEVVEQLLLVACEPEQPLEGVRVKARKREKPLASGKPFVFVDYEVIRE